MTATVNIEIPEPLTFLLTKSSRYKVAYGGRGSGKSTTFARCLILLSLQSKIRVLCTRNLQNSIADSVHKLLADSIDAMQLTSLFHVTHESISCNITGSDFIFKGIKNNIADIKSLEGVNYCWVEEAQNVTEESWDTLIPTIRREGSEIWISFNPDKKTDATYQRFVVSPPDNCISVPMNYDQNPWFPDVLREEMEFTKKTNFQKYLHIWEGVPNAEAGNLIKIDKFRRYDILPPRFTSVFICCDTAFSEKKSADNSAFLSAGLDGKNLYLLDGYCKKVTFPDLKRDLTNFYMKIKAEYCITSPFTSVYIENKASGISLIQELRANGLPIAEVYPTVMNTEAKKEQTADKYTRFLEVESDIDSGYVYVPNNAPWLPEFEAQCEAFTGGKQDFHDDFVDAFIYTLKIRRKHQSPDWRSFKRVFTTRY